MKRIFYAVALVLIWSLSAQATMIYLKAGGQIKAKKAWREKGKVVVLINRDSITTFDNSELNLKKTFPHHKKRHKQMKATVKTPAAVPNASVTSAAPAVAQPARNDKKSLLPGLPERKIPQGSEEGVLRKQKREMEQKLNE